MPNIRSLLTDYGFRKIHSSLYQRSSTKTLIIFSSSRAYVWPRYSSKPLACSLEKYIEALAKS